MSHQEIYAEALSNVDALLHSLPPVVMLAVLIACILTVSGLTQLAVEESRAGRLNPISALIGLAALTAIGYKVDGVGGAVLSLAVSACLFVFAMTVRRSVYDFQRRLNRDKAYAKQSK
jgi:hypothetical protein